MKIAIKNKLRKIRTFFKDLITRIVKDDFTGMAAEMAYIFILAFFPFMIFLVSLFGLLGSEDQIYRLMSFLNEITPLQSMSIIEKTLRNVLYSSSKGLVTIGFLMTLFLASNAAVVSIKGMNKAYHTKETRNFWIIRGLSVFIVLLDGVVLFFGTNLIVFGRVILEFISEFVPISIDWNTLFCSSGGRFRFWVCSSCHS
jgi:membrane protein